MEFNDSEVKVIAAARKKVSFSKIVHIFFLALMLAGIFLMAKGLLTTEHLFYALLAAVFISIAYPQFGWGPKYEDLVKILEEKTKRQP